MASLVVHVGRVPTAVVGFYPPCALEKLSYYPGSSVKGRTGGLGLKASQTEKGFGSDSASLSTVARPWRRSRSQ